MNTHIDKLDFSLTLFFLPAISSTGSGSSSSSGISSGNEVFENS